MRLPRAVLLCLALLGVFASPAAAGTVTLETDTIDPALFIPTVPGELRYEIVNAAPGETVEIAPGVDPALTKGHILIDKNLTVEGQGADATSITVPASNSRVFMIGSMVPASVVTIRDLRMAGGRPANGAAGSGAAGGNGGAIHTNADLTLDRVRFYLNRAGNGGSGAIGANGNPIGGTGGTGGGGGFGGAVFNQVGGDLTVTDSTFDGNSAGDGGTGGQGGNGGGMFAIAGNGGTGGPGQDGGAIHNTGDLTVANSTFFGNTSGQGGTGGDKGSFGGLGAGGDGGPGGDGGAIHQGGAGSVTLTNTTIASNVASSGGLAGIGAGPPVPDGDPGAGGAGGGTFFFNSVTPTIANSLYSQNDAVSGSNCAGGGPITAVGSNLSFPSGGCSGSFSNGDPQLGALADNGGPTETMALGPGSAAINQVPVGSPSCPGVDQRGVTRPQGPTCDIGAFELEMSAAAVPPAKTQSNGHRVAALKKCKKRFPKGPKRKKCIKKAKKLPV